MALRLEAVTFDAADAAVQRSVIAVAAFWAGLLGREQQTAVQSPLGGTKISWDCWDGPPVKPGHGRNRQRFDLVTADPASEAERLVSLGANRLSALPDGVELADPDGNEFGLHSA